jgi:hypothetical protein
MTSDGDDNAPDFIIDAYFWNPVDKKYLNLRCNVDTGSEHLMISQEHVEALRLTWNPYTGDELHTVKHQNIEVVGQVRIWWTPVKRAELLDDKWLVVEDLAHDVNIGRTRWHQVKSSLPNEVLGRGGRDLLTQAEKRGGEYEFMYDKNKKATEVHAIPSRTDTPYGYASAIPNHYDLAANHWNSSTLTGAQNTSISFEGAESRPEDCTASFRVNEANSERLHAHPVASEELNSATKLWKRQRNIARRLKSGIEHLNSIKNGRKDSDKERKQKKQER